MKAPSAAPVLRAVVDPATWVAGLAHTVGFALDALADPRSPHPAMRDGQLASLPGRRGRSTATEEATERGGDDGGHADLIAEPERYVS